MRQEIPFTTSGEALERAWTCFYYSDFILIQQLPSVSQSNPRTFPSFRFFFCKIMILITILQGFFCKKKIKLCGFRNQNHFLHIFRLTFFFFLVLRFKKYTKGQKSFESCINTHKYNQSSFPNIRKITYFISTNL